MRAVYLCVACSDRKAWSRSKCAFRFNVYDITSLDILLVKCVSIVVFTYIVCCWRSQGERAKTSFAY